MLRTLLTTAAALALMFTGTATALACGNGGAAAPSNNTRTQNHTCTNDHVFLNVLSCEDLLDFQHQDDD